MTTNVTNAGYIGRMKEKPEPTRFWFIVQNERGGYTLRGGWPLEMMKEDPDLLQMDVGLNFTTKDELLKHLDEISFCLEHDKVIVDGNRIIRS